jgi:phosphopantetheinyl transferase
VLAHGLRRFALALMLDVSPVELVFRDDENRQPKLIKPNHSTISFSHSHTREGVLFAASSDAAVGVDAESVANESTDITLLRSYLVLPEHDEAQAASFCDYWTALEAFWKAAGTGLSTDHPRLLLSAHPLGYWDVAFDASHRPDLPKVATHAVIFPVTAPPGCVASLAIIRPSESGTIAFAIHEKELNKETQQMSRYLFPESAKGNANHVQCHKVNQLSKATNRP